MGLLKAFVRDMKNIFPESMRTYRNEETGEFAMEVVNKPNSFGTPKVVRAYSNKQRGITMTEDLNDMKETGFWGNVGQIQNETKQLERKECKQIE